MDESRVSDLTRLQAVLDNPNKSAYVKGRAQKTKDSIIKQSKDPVLRRLRDRLIKAAKANDEYEQWKISAEIKAHMHEQKLDKPV